MNEFMTMTEAADYLGVSMLTLRGIVKRQNLSVTRGTVDTRQKFLKRSEIEALKNPTYRPEAPAVFYPEPEELAEIKEAIAESEDEKQRGFVISHEQLTARIADRLAAYRMRQDRASA